MANAYRDFCDALWRSWLAGTLDVSPSLHRDFDLDAAREPYLAFCAGARPLVAVAASRAMQNCEDRAPDWDSCGTDVGQGNRAMPVPSIDGLAEHSRPPPSRPTVTSLAASPRIAPRLPHGRRRAHRCRPVRAWYSARRRIYRRSRFGAERWTTARTSSH